MAAVRGRDNGGTRRRLAGRYCDAGDLQALQDDADGALELYQRAVELDADSARAHVGLGDAHLLAERDDRALGAYRKRSPHAPTARGALCVADMLTGGPAQRGRLRVEEAVDLAPERSYYLYRLADLYMRTGTWRC